ncbi:von Willebrand factor type A domain-containing protein [Prosthecobacter sp.]|jgi:autotransporter-associated beta strand protein|uniref:YfbK domain-containing protein n=1 Tax=Prosthecobacter sp. TaxID=1965333 RepID=UPI0037838C92
MKPEQITAWALDEASAEERERLEVELRDDPKAKQAAEATKEFCHFLLTELRDDSLALTDEQRERLQARPTISTAQPGGPKPGQRTQWRTGVIVRLALAACVVLGAFWTWNVYETRQLSRFAMDGVALNEDAKEHRVQLQRRVSEVTRAKPMSESRLLEEKTLESLSAAVPGKTLAAPSAPQTSPEIPRMLTIHSGQTTMTADDVVELKKLQDQTAYGLSSAKSDPAAARTLAVTAGTSLDLNGMTVAGSGGVNKTGDGTVVLRGGSVDHPGAAVSSGTLAIGGGVITTPQSSAAPASGPVDLIKAGAGTLTLGGANTYTGTTVTVDGIVSGGGTTATAAKPMEGWAAPVITLGAFTTATPASPTVVMNPQPDAYYFADVKDSDSDGLRRQRLLERETAPEQRRKSGAEGESYTRIIENELKDVAREPLSTFSIDVDTASYANVRRFLNQNMIPPADAVRIEELVNYFPTAEEGPVPTAKEPFGVRVELAPCPWQPVHRLARIAIKGRELGNERKNSNLVFLVDVSGSMNEPSKLPLVQQSLRMLTEQLGEGDRVTMVVYAGSSGLVLPPTNGEKKSEILAAIDKLQAGGSTHGSAGIQLAYEQAVAGFIKEGVNRVILCTDGDFNVGVSSPEELEKLITKKAKSGVFLSVLGFGSGNLKDRTMETLADKGNGNYAYIDSLSEARKVLVEQMSGTLVTIAKDVKIQVEFNPAAVRSYRLIGYENRMLAKEDFNDDTKDAGEIGAGHSVVALYEVVPANLPHGTESRPAVDSLKYQAPVISPAQLAEAAKSGEMMTVKLRYKEPDGELSKLIEKPVKDEGKTLTASSEEYKFSAAVAGFGLLLRDSAYKGTLSWETVRRLAIDGKGADKLGYRGEFLQLIDKARGLKETRP